MHRFFKPSIFLLILQFIFQGVVFGQNNPIVLDGTKLTIEDVVGVARGGRGVTFSDATLKQVSKAHELLLLGAKKDFAIYGLNRGVGLNKDRKIFVGESIDPEILEVSKEFNRNLILSHSTGIGLDMPEEVIRASMLVRLNGLLRAVSGAQPEVALLLKTFLNEGIHPLMPARGSLGEADIAILAHIGLAMIGEGDVIYKGVKMPAAKAFKTVGIKPLIPYAKDALSILSSNAYSVALAALTLYDTFSILEQVNAIYAMSLEGLNGNIAPLLWEVQKVRPYCGQWDVAKRTRQILEGSYLWDIDEKRALQDPLSFRTGTQVQGACLDVCRSL